MVYLYASFCQPLATDWLFVGGGSVKLPRTSGLPHGRGGGGGGCSVQRKQISGKEMLQVGQVGIEIEREGAVVGVPTVGFYPTGGQDFQTNLCAQKVQLTLMSCWKKRFYS